MKNTAQKLIQRFNLIRKDESNFCDTVLLDGFWETCEYFAVDSFDWDRRSYDSSRCFKFEDGSALWLSNPRQAAYPASVSEMGTPTLHDFDTVKAGRFE